jgi:hypothetical protein
MLGVALFGSLIVAHNQFFTGLHTALMVCIAALLLGAMLTPVLTPRERRTEDVIANRAASRTARARAAGCSRT